MDAQEFRKHAHQAVEDIVNYMENLNERPVLSQVRPGYLRDLIPSEAPKEPEDFDLVMKEFHEKIMPGITHWQSGKFMAYFPSGFSYPSVLGEMYNAMVAVIGFNWINSPAVTELEHVMMDWWVRLLGLGDGFLSTGKGGGVIQNSATDSLIVCMAAATKRQIHALASDEDVDTSVLRAKMVIYGSDQTHSGTAKAARLLGYIHRVVPTDDSCVLKGSVLKAVMDRDVQKGLIPLLITATIGTTGFGSMDDLPSIVEAGK
ncbi:hypothetical protein H4R33_006706 [Dimargaris cristalligena]|nr:hypothetical protein H4R33_006706 [Dimargaris cristalligena]